MKSISIELLENYANINKYMHDQIKEICKITKTNERVKSYGSLATQPLLICSICSIANCENFFEIGTGRGTTSLSVSLLKHIKKVITIDILDFDEKRDTYIDFKKAYVSNHDLYDMVPYDEKEKVMYCKNISYDFPKSAFQNYFDVLFIDGNHKVDNIIIDDFMVCEYMAKNEYIIVFDDYGPDWATTRVVDDLIKKRDDLSFFLISTMKEYPKWGHVIVTKKNNKFDDVFTKFTINT